MALHKEHNYNFALEKYILLQEQHEELSNHLQQIRPRQHSASSISTRSSSTSSSPKRHTRSSERHSSRRRARYGSQDGAGALDTIVDEETLHEISVEEERLFDVNESIKRALTELLNCEAVRGDDATRMWAQARLMETEKELRSRRRRSRAALCSR